MTRSVVFLEPKGTILEVVRAAKRRGFHVAALRSDPALLDGAPEPYASAVPLIDEIIPIQGWDAESAVLAACEAVHARAPITGLYAGMDPCASILARLRRRFSLPAPDPEAIALVLNKFALRRRLVELGLSRLKNAHSSEAEGWTSWPFRGAAYFKPVHGFFSAYVSRCENLADFRAARDRWRTGNGTDPAWLKDYLHSLNEYHLEEAFDGELLSVEAIASGGRYEPLGLLSRILYSRDPVVEMGSCFPYPHPLSGKIIDLARRAHAALGLHDGPTHTEMIVSPAGEVEIIDLNPRFVGADVLQSINNAFGVRVEEALLDYAIGKPARVAPEDRRFSCLQYFLPPRVPVLETVDFPEVPEVKFRATFIKPGTPISSNDRQIDYLGCYLTVMPEFEAALSRSRELRAAVMINGSEPGVF
ncbi:MAG: ATP-grasp domain-containing protein [Elusimicrobia bacterium]|nr:ATP-grasp domain-containing protein [Elusimicrobiota bacterium]